MKFVTADTLYRNFFPSLRGREKGNIKEAQGLSKLEALRQDAIDQLEEGSFNPASFNEKFKELSEDFADELSNNPRLQGAFDRIGGKFGDMTEDQVNSITNALDADLPFLDSIQGFQDTLENIGSVLATPQTALLAAAGVLVNSIKIQRGVVESSISFGSV